MDADKIDVKTSEAKDLKASNAFWFVLIWPFLGGLAVKGLLHFIGVYLRLQQFHTL